MRIEHVFNNNVVLAIDDASRQVILVGNGLGHCARRGRTVDQGRVVRVFVPEDGEDNELLTRLLSGIAPEHIQLVCQALADAGLERFARDFAQVVPLADHVSFALRRVESGLQMHYPLIAEVTHLYPDEYANARALVAAINARSAIKLPDVEAIGLALHLVNVGFMTGDLSSTYKMTYLIQQMVSVVAHTLGCNLDHGSVSVGRFVLHLRYLFARIQEHQQLDQDQSAVGLAIRDAYPEAVECATRLASLVQIRLGSTLTDDEVAYLALHVGRLEADHLGSEDQSNIATGRPATAEGEVGSPAKSPSFSRRPEALDPAVGDASERREVNAR